QRYGAEEALQAEIGKASVAQAIQAAQSGESQSVWEPSIRRAAEADPHSPAYQCVLGALDLLSGDSSGCLRRMEQAKQHQDGRMEATVDYLMGLAALQMGDSARAESLLSAASQAARKQGIPLNIDMPRAFALARMQRWEEAAEILCRMVS